MYGFSRKDADHNRSVIKNALKRCGYTKDLVVVSWCESHSHIILPKSQPDEESYAYFRVYTRKIEVKEDIRKVLASVHKMEWRGLFDCRSLPIVWCACETEDL